MDMQSLSIHFAPLLSDAALVIIALLMTALLAASWFRAQHSTFLRGLTFAAFFLILLNPSIHEEQRESVPGVVAVIVDESASQNFGDREQRTNAALSHIEEKLARFDNIEVRVARGPQDGAFANQTDLYATLEQLYADVPESRRAGVIFITDGQIHDLPPLESITDNYGPVHGLLSGRKDETDRRITIINAPAFGIVGKSITATYKIEDQGYLRNKNARVELRYADGPPQVFIVKTGEEHSIELPVHHGGQNVFELKVAPLPGELTQVNNKATIDFQGVRDRLRVLLVSGKPHAGGRTWRDLLTADPSVDLVHFTILREPDKIDATPQREMSLIAFPFRELFELKLYEFDLIIFDRYRLSRILPDQYFQNIARYVQEGGAFLEASGPEYASEDSIYYTALNQILPGTPTSEVLNNSFTPEISRLGTAHPVTRNLKWNNADEGAPWGPWSLQVSLENVRGDVLMNGRGDKPLLILNRETEGRVAQIASNHIWLWSRGYKGGGPHAELLRRVVHWLMKEPELDEHALDISVHNNTIVVRRAGFERENNNITMIKPDGVSESVTLEDKANNGILEYLHRAEEPGIYSFETSDGNRRFAIVGDLDTPEYRNVLTNEKALSPLVDKMDGGLIWLSETSRPDIKLRKNGNFAGHNWLALKDTSAYVVTGASEKPLLPLWLSVSLLLALSVFTWFYEGRRH